MHVESSSRSLDIENYQYDNIKLKTTLIEMHFKRIDSSKHLKKFNISSSNF